MTSMGWPLVEVAAQLLQRDEREAALGDLVEDQRMRMARVCLMSLLSSYRQSLLWKSWRPWLAAFGLTRQAASF